MKLLNAVMKQQQDFPLLEIFTFGGFHLKCGGETLKNLKSQKAKALVAYLAVSKSPKSRDVLADLFWEGRTQSQAQSNLRTILSRLRKEIGEYISIDRNSVELNRDGNLWIDVNELSDALHSINVAGQISSLETACQIEKTLDLYQGEFLDGFYLRDCNTFENWLFRERELLRKQVISQYQDLINFNICLRNFQSVMILLQKLLLLDPLLESIHRQLMFLLFYEDQREAALDQFELCKKILKDELEVEPSSETTALFEVLRKGERVDPSIASELPELTPFFEPATNDGPIFVGRENQLAKMELHLVKAINGKGQIVLISGEAGSGKTALASEFARRALNKYPNLLIASGRCNSFSGQGEPFFPLHQILETLSCVTPPEWPEASERLWEAFPQTITTALTKGPELIDKLIDPDKLMSTAFAALGKEKEWLESLQKLIQSVRDNPKVHNSQYITDMFNRVLVSISKQTPLLIILDDLQWVDNASCNLLFDLFRNIGDSHICMVLLYRPSEVYGKESEHSPFEPLIYESKIQLGDIEINLDSVSKPEARAFIDTYLDSEPNQLDDNFRENLFAQTGGNPLFTIELLRTMQDRGDILQIQHKGWIADENLSWDKLPARVAGAIEARFARLDDWSQEILEAACVIGEEFDLQVLSQVLNRDEGEIQRTLVNLLNFRHRFVTEIGVQQKSNDTSPRFRFSHHLIQKYLYSRLSAGQRRLGHHAIAKAIERFLPENLTELAYHYSKADDSEKAVGYLIKVADKARFQYAIKEAVDHYLRALTFIEEIENQDLAVRTWMKLALTYQNNFEFEAAEKAYTKAFDLQNTRGKSILGIGQAPAPHPLRLVRREPLTLDPIYCWEVVSGQIVEQLFSGLVTVTPRGNVLPDVASDWEMEDGGRRFKFHLRQDSVWSDGVPVTAGDFEFAIKRALQPKNTSPNATYHYEIVNAFLFNKGKLTNPDLIGVRSLDNHTLEFELEKPTAYFPQLVGTLAFFPAPQHSIQKYGNNWTDPDKIVSNGPFQLDSWEHGNSFVLKKNPGYHGQFRGNLEFVECTCYDQNINILQAYLDENFDMISIRNLTWDQQIFAQQYLGEEFHSRPLSSSQYLVFDTQTKPFDDPRIRRSLTLATDRGTLIKNVFYGMTPANGGLLPPGIPGHTPNIAIPYDPHQARNLLAEAGFPEGKGFPVMEGAYSDQIGATRATIANHLKEMWLENIGVLVNWTEYNWNEMIQLALGRRPMVYFGSWIADYYDPNNFFVDAIWNRKADQENLWDHQKYNHLIEKAKMIFDQEKRIDLYRQADRIIVEEAPIIPLFYGRTQTLQKPWIKGVTLSPIGSASYKDIIIEEH